MENSFYSQDEVRKIGLKTFGQNVLISRKASIYEPEKISLGNHVRIDDFCILSGNISIGSYVHISAYTALYAKFGIILEDFVTISGRTLIYSQTDDYSGMFMTNPTLPSNVINITGGTVRIKRFSIIAAGCIVFPNVTLQEGVAVGAMSLINEDLESWKIYAGIPAKLIKDRNKNILNLYQSIIQ